MRLHFVTVPIHNSASAETELNKFLAGSRVIAVDRQLVADGPRSAWAVCVAYVDGASTASGSSDPSGKKRVDYREILPAAEFEVFAKLRDLRKQIAEREGVPPYAVFTNEQLAEAVRRRVHTSGELAGIEGVGPARVEKYAGRFLAILNAAKLPTEESTPDAAT